MFDSDLDEVEKVLSVSKDKIESKGLSSVRSRVTNIKPYVSDPDMDVKQFIGVLKRAMAEQFDTEDYRLTERDIQAVLRLKETIYDRWEWNYGASPAYCIRKWRRVAGCGKLEISMDVEEGKISGIDFWGDYFGNGDPEQLQQLLLGCRLEESMLKERLSNISIGSYFHNLDIDTFVSILLE